MAVKRDEKADTWNLGLVSQDDLKVVEENNLAFINKWKDRTDFLENPQILLAALDEYEVLNRRYGTSGNTGYKTWLMSQLDKNDPILKGKLNKIEEFSINLANQIQFFAIKLAKVSQDKQQEFLNFPGLGKYKHFLERLFAVSKYILSDPEEKILNLKSQPAHSYWTKMTSAFLAAEQKNKKNLPILMNDLKSHNKNLRDIAARHINEILAKYADVAENEINAILTNKKIDDDLKNITRPDLPRHLSDDIDSTVVDTMLDEVSKRFDIAQRFYKFRAKILRLKKLKYHERMIPFGKVAQKYNFNQAYQLVKKVFTALEPQFGEILENFQSEGRFDVYPKLGKSDGAFCVAELITQPVFILLNHTGNLKDVLTLAHEMGHGINDELMKTLPSALDYGTPLSTAEVASTFMEDFVLEELLKNAKGKERLSLLIHKLDDDISSIFRQVACYNFEKDIHTEFRKTGYLSKKQIGEIFIKNMSAYMGPAVEQSPGSQNWWVYWSHIRRFFYVYSYASGLLISKSLQHSVRADPGFIIKVKQFLAKGSSDSPKNIFASLGVDISDQQFWQQGLLEIDKLLTEAENLWKEVK